MKISNKITGLPVWDSNMVWSEIKSRSFNQGCAEQVTHGTSTPSSMVAEGGPAVFSSPLMGNERTHVPYEMLISTYGERKNSCSLRDAHQYLGEKFLHKELNGGAYPGNRGFFWILRIALTFTTEKSHFRKPTELRQPVPCGTWTTKPEWPSPPSPFMVVEPAPTDREKNVGSAEKRLDIPSTT